MEKSTALILGVAVAGTLFVAYLVAKGITNIMNIPNQIGKDLMAIPDSIYNGANFFTHRPVVTTSSVQTSDPNLTIESYAQTGAENVSSAGHGYAITLQKGQPWIPRSGR